MSDLPLADNFPQADDATWRALVDKALKGADFDKTLVSRTADGLRIKPLYTRGDERGEDSAGVPGSAPYIRGFRAVAGDPPWHIRQLHALGNPAEINLAILNDLEGGASAIALRIAAPGQTGLQLRSPDELARALDGVALDFAGVWLEAGHNVAIAAAALQDVWNRNVVQNGKAMGGFGCDPLGTLARTGGHPLSLEQAYVEMADLAKLTRDDYPCVTAISVDTRPYHDGGASEAQELACLCATLVAYLRALDGAGLSPADALGQMEFSLACDQDFFASMTKLRASRALIARIADVSGAVDPVPGLHLHATTSPRMFARHDPQVNILRTTIACAAAALGGADAITVLPYTYANGQPDSFARRIARNIQIILQEESSLGMVADPAGGNWYVEDFTRELAEKSWKLFQSIEKEGGMAEALAKGYIQHIVAATAEQRAREVTLGERELTGVSSFANLAEDPAGAEPYPLPEELEEPAITVEPVPPRRPAEPFERLRGESDAYLKKLGHRPRAVLVTLGAESGHAARVTYARRFFAAGGIETQPAGAGKYIGKTSPIACLCASDEDLKKDGADTARTLIKAGAKLVYSVGRPGELRKNLKDAGVGGFLHKGCDMLETLEQAHDVLGMRQDPTG